MGTRTPKLNLYKPAFDEDLYDDEVNGGFDVLDDALLRTSGKYPRVRYAAPWGSDSNDGLSWHTAKLTIYGAFDVLPTVFGQRTGEIRIADNTVPNPNDPQKGIWTCSGTAPNSDWRAVNREVRFVGIGPGYSEIGGPPLVGPRIGTTNSEDGVMDPTKPAIWIGGGNYRTVFRNLSVHRHPASVYIGPNGVFSNTVQNTSFHFEGCTFGGPDTPAYRTHPSVQMKGWIFNGYWDDCTFGAQDATLAGPGSDGHVAVLMDAADPSLRDSNEAYLQYFNRCFFAGGGVKDKAGGGDIHMVDCFSESTANGDNAPDLWIQRGHGGTGNSSVLNFSHYDANVVAGLQAITVETLDTTWDASKVLVVGGWQVRTQGPITRIASDSEPMRADTPPWAIQESAGFGLNEYVQGKHPSGPWQFGVQTAIGDNLAVTPASYFYGGGFAPTVTGSVRGPDGLLNATRLAPNSPHANCYADLATVGAFTNEYVFFGLWQRFITGPADQLNPVSTSAFRDTHTVTAGSDLFHWPEFALNEWVWTSGWWRGDGVSAGLVFQVQVAYETIEIAYPLVFRVASANLSDAGAAEMARHIGATPFYLPPGAAGSAVGQKIMAHGGLGVGNSVAATEVIGKAVTKKIQMFDELGNSIGYVPVYSSIT